MLKTIVNNIRHLGVDLHEDILEQKRTMLLNEISLFLAVIVLFYTPQAFILDNTPLNLAAILLAEVCIIIPIFLNVQGLTKMARWVFCIINVLFILAVIMVYGTQFRMDFVFLLFAMISVIFFTKGWQRLVLLLFIAACQAFSIYYSTHYEPLIPSFTIRYTEIITFAAVNIGVVVIIGRYISASTLIETNLKSAIEELDTKSQILLQNQQQIQEQNLKLETANQELEKFAYIASHDLKSPLRSVNGFLKLIKYKIKDQDNPAIIEEIDAATQRTEQMNFLIQDILDFSKIGVDSQLSDVNLEELLQTLQIEMRDDLATKNASIHTDSPLPVIHANPKQILMLFHHLIENGLLYNQSKSPLVTIKFTLNEEHLIFKFKDNGIGIAPIDQTTVFEMFKRLHTQEQYKGSGVGLAVCKKIVEQYHGQIQLESQLHQGTTVTIKFPKLMFIEHNS